MTVEEIITRLDAKKNGVGHKAKCPAHGDTHASLSIGVGDGKILVKCHAGCTAEAICGALGMKVSDLFSDDARRKQKITVTDIAAHKKLSPTFLRDLGVHDLDRGGIGITYRDCDRNVAAVKGRGSLVAKEGSWWMQGKPLAYGVDRLAVARELGYLVLVEGESDCWTLWHAEIPALGVPGADLTKVVTPQLLDGIAKVYAIREPDKGGHIFIAGLTKQLGADRFVEVRLDGAKDPSEMFVQDPATFKQRFAAALEKRIAARYRSASDRARDIGALPRIPTGFATFDANTRGGPRVGKRIVLGGAPGAGKTTWLVQLLWSYALAGYVVLLVAFDEEADDILIRVGQLNGLCREELEDEHREGHVGAKARLVELLNENPNFNLIDADEDEMTIEDASAELVRLRQAGQLSILGVDSIQTARVNGDADADTAKARVDMVMAAAKRAGKVDKHLVFATCELNRGGYGSNNPAERVNDLAAFKESGGVEYGASMAMVLRQVKDADGLINVSTPKNRMGSKKPFRLQLDFRTAKVSEVELPAPEAEEAIASPLQQAKDKLMAVIEKSIQPINSASELARRAKIGKAKALRAVKELLEDGRLDTREGAFVAVPSGSGTGSEPGQRSTGSTVPALRAEPGTGTAAGTGKTRPGKKMALEPIVGSE